MLLSDILYALGKNRMRLLVVDDHEAVRKGVCIIVGARKDMEVCGEASDGQEAIEKAQQLKPDLIILDITMPRLSGFEAAVELRKILADVPILFLSMHHGAELIETSKRIGVRGFVNKSQVANILLRAIDVLLSGGTFWESEQPASSTAPLVSNYSN